MYSCWSLYEHLVTVQRHERVSLHGIYEELIQSSQKLLGLCSYLVHFTNEFRLNQFARDFGDG
jgi:hypothetical protein